MTNQDAKLSAADRRKLKSSTFCGPGRSFPVPDCAHVRAAMRLLNRASVSESTRSKIRACVSRRNKSLGCGVNSDDNTTDKELETLLDSEIFDSTYEVIEFIQEMEDSSEHMQQEQQKLSAIDHIISMRSKRGIEHKKEDYMLRSFGSIINTLLDELERSKNG